MSINPKVNFKSGIPDRWKVPSLCVLLIVFVVTSVSCVQSKENAKELPTPGNVNSTIGDQLVEPEAWELAFRESKGMHSLHFEFPVGE
ncbi:MAG: hypothetical protein ACPGWM_02560, partial [Flavobacteriales bacterium]